RLARPVLSRFRTRGEVHHETDLPGRSAAGSGILSAAQRACPAATPAGESDFTPLRRAVDPGPLAGLAGQRGVLRRSLERTGRRRERAGADRPLPGPG